MTAGLGQSDLDDFGFVELGVICAQLVWGQPDFIFVRWQCGKRQHDDD
jgi:hypothetical protein